MENVDKRVKMGKGARIDPSAYVGVDPLRRILKMYTVIGKGAIFLRGSIVYLGSRIGDNLLIAHNAIIREENVIGDNFKLWSNSILDYGCKIGNNVKIHSNCYVSQFSKIEDNCFIAPGVIFANDVHPGCKFSDQCLKGPIIKKGAQIGCNVTICPGVQIGQNSIVGAGSVVTKDVPANVVVCGNPSKVIKLISGIDCTLFPGKKYRNKNL